MNTAVIRFTNCLECPNCHEWYNEEKWNFKEN